MNLVSSNSGLSYERQLEIVAKEKEYRKNEALNFSAIKDFDEQGPFEFYKKHIAKEREPKKDSDALDMGNLVDCLLTVPDTFDQRFHIFNSNDIVKGQSKELVDEMFIIAKAHYNDETDQVDLGFEELFRTAFDSVAINKSTGEVVKFKGKRWEEVMSVFIGSSMEEYYDSLLANVNKRTVMPSQAQMAEAIVNTIKSVPKIYEIYNKPSVEIYNQYPLYFKYKDFEMKGLLDTLHIDREKKLVQEFDLKTSWSTLGFEYNRIQNRYYLQEAVYFVGLSAMFPDYTILPRKYIVADSRNHIRPYVASTTSKHLEQGLNGFVSPSGRTYKGLDELLSEMQWHFNNSIWNTTKKIHENFDEIELDLFG